MLESDKDTNSQMSSGNEIPVSRRETVRDWKSVFVDALLQDFQHSVAREPSPFVKHTKVAWRYLRLVQLFI